MSERAVLIDALRAIGIQRYAQFDAKLIRRTVRRAAEILSSDEAIQGPRRSVTSRTGVSDGTPQGPPVCQTPEDAGRGPTASIVESVAILLHAYDCEDGAPEWETRDDWRAWWMDEAALVNRPRYRKRAHEVLRVVATGMLDEAAGAGSWHWPEREDA